MSKNCIVTVKAGVCGKTSRIIAEPGEDGMSVIVRIETDCPMVGKNPVPVVIPWEEVGAPFSESNVYAWATENIRHTACPVPSGIIKSIEVAGGLGLKKDVSMTFE